MGNGVYEGMNRTKQLNILLISCMSACLLGLLALAIWIPVSTQHLVHVAATAERAAVQSLAGALLPEHPELEADFITALQTPTENNRLLGAQILGRYGYRDEPPLLENPFYVSSLQSQQANIALFLCSAALLILFLLLWLTQQRKKHDQRILTVIDRYLTEDYSFTEAGSLGKRSGEGNLNLIGDKLKQLGHQIRLKNERIQEEKENTKAFVTDISHQLKTPIASLKTCFSLLLESENETEKEEFFHRSDLQIDKLETLTQTLVNISRLENAMIRLLPEPISLFELLIRSVNGIYDKASKKEIQIELEPFDDFPVLADLKWTAEAIGNLLDNAIKYSLSQTKITIRIHKMTTLCAVEISDQGTGIPKEEQNKVFQRFYRGNGPIVQKSEGSGVGLYLSRFILEQQGGSISISSSSGQGTTFLLHIRLF